MTAASTQPICPPQGSSPKLGGHIPALDGVRGVAILLVMMFHGPIFYVNTTLEDYALRLTQFGWCGVDLFFVLSGFLITGILHDAKGSEHYFRNFYARRLFRIFPLYYATLAVAFFVIPGVFHVNHAMQGDRPWFWLYVSNFWCIAHYELHSRPLAVTWSLAIEEQFYLLWPAVMYFSSRRAMMTICAAIVPGALALRVGLLVAGYGPEVLYYATFCRLDTLAVGGFVALAARGPGGIEALVPVARGVGVVSSMVIMGVFLWQRTFDPMSVGNLTIGCTGLALLFGSVLVLVVAARPDRTVVRVLCQRWLVLFGKLSYGLYLFHVPVQRNISEHVFGRDQLRVLTGVQLVGQLGFYVLTTAVTLLIAWLSWHLFEKHFLKLKRHFPY